MRHMDSKPDWPEAQERMTAWWAGEPLDRVVGSIVAPRAGVEPRPLDMRAPQRWIDLDTILHNIEVQIERTFYGGEAFPGHWVYHGPVPASMYFGCTPHFQESTVWYSPVFDSWEAAETWEFDPHNEWWQMALRLSQEIVERAEGRFLVSNNEICGLADVIASLWGASSMLEQLGDDPQVIKRLLMRMTEIGLVLQDELTAIITPHQEGSFDWIELWGPGQVFTAQNDMCCMLSPQMFEEVFLPEIRAQLDHADHGVYHLDGPGAVKQLDALLSLESLRCIQWVPGAGESQDPLDWLDVYRHIQEAGRRVLVYCPPERVPEVLSRLDRRLTYLSVWCPDEASAHAALRALERIGV